MNKDSFRNKKKFMERYNKFFFDFYDLNTDVLGNIDTVIRSCEEIPCRKLTIYNDGNDELVLPRGYRVVDKTDNRFRRTTSTYISGKDGEVVCGISYMNANQNNGEEYSYPRNNISTYKEHILEQACIITENYLGDNKEDYLKIAIERMMEGNYSYFPKYNNTRFKLVLIKRVRIPKVMISTLQRHNITVNSTSIGAITDLYVDYIKDKVNSFEKNNSKGYTKSLNR